MSAGVSSLICLLADDAAAAGAVPTAQTGHILQMMFPLMLMFGLFYFLIMRPERRRRAEHQLLLASLTKNDRVITVGGIYGVVTNVQPDADRVTLKVDEVNNLKLDVAFSAIARVIVDQPAS